MAPDESSSTFVRAAMLDRLGAETFDVLVIGGGITGVGVALDAASRGLRTALVERDDFASGTSSKSSKLSHGGLRYLEQGHVGLVREALAEGLAGDRERVQVQQRLQLAQHRADAVAQGEHAVGHQPGLHHRRDLKRLALANQVSHRIVGDQNLKGSAAATAA